MFKLIGTIAGYYFFGFIGALIGLFIGQIIDRSRAYGIGAINPLKNAIRQQVFMETAFFSMGKLAKADGRVSEEEIRHAEVFMEKLGMTTEHRQQAITWFKQGTAPESDLAATYQRFMNVCGQTLQLRQMLLVVLMGIALSDGEIHPEEARLLELIANWLQYDPEKFRQLLDMVRNQKHFAHGQQNHEDALDEAYKALGINKENSDQEVKRAYRKLISQYHPDKLIGQGMPEDMIAVATEKAKEIQVAYDLIMKSRTA